MNSKWVCEGNKTDSTQTREDFIRSNKGKSLEEGRVQQVKHCRYQIKKQQAVY